MLTTPKMLQIALIAIGLSLSLVAQETAERIAPPPAGITAQDNDPPVDEARPDTRPVTGLLPLTVGNFGTERSFLAPSFGLSQAVDTNPLVVSGQSETIPVTGLSGNVVLEQVWRGSQFLLNYTAGGSIYGGNSELNRTFQAMKIQQAFQFRHWSLTLADDVTVTPESTFGYSALSSFSGSTFTPGTAPNQSVLINQSRQISNVAVGQVNYELNSRSSFTLAGNFGILRFPDGNFLESNQGGIQIGYNHNLNSRDSLGISYGLNLVRSPNAATAQKLDSHIVQLAYGRRITGHLAFGVSGGPEINEFEDPILGHMTKTAWTAQSSMTYRLRGAQMQVSYSHGATAGAGVIGVATTDQIQGGLTTRLTRTLSASIRPGYAHNTSAQPATNTPNPSFNTEFVGATLGRPLGHQGTLSLNYTFQHQSTNVLACSLGLCGADLSRHVLGVAFDWHMRPLLIH